MQTEHMTMAQALAKFLNQQYICVGGVETLFVEGIATIFGHGNMLGIGQTLEQAPGHLWVMQGCNEQRIAHMATGFAKQYRRQYILAVTSLVGPGVTNMVTVAAATTANRISLLLSPDNIYASRQPGPVLQQTEQYHGLGISTNDRFRPVSRCWDRTNRPEQLMSAILNAMRALTDPVDTGVVTIRLPQDMWGKARDYPQSFPTRRVHLTKYRPPDPQRLTMARALIVCKRCPLVVCGDGVQYSGAHEAFRTFVETLQLPFTEIQAGEGVLVSGRSLNLGGTGVTGRVVVNQLASRTDLVIGTGTRLADFTADSKALSSHPEIEFLLLNMVGFNAPRLDATVLIVDARTGLTASTETLKDYRSNWGEEVAQAQEV